MKRKAVSGIMLTLLFIGMLTLAFNIQPVKAELKTIYVDARNIDDPLPIIIDTDLAPDDIGAILYLLKHPRISVRAITVSCGETYMETGVINILRLLDYLGIQDIPVAAGKNTPLYTNHTFPAQWRERSVGFYGLDLPLTDLQPSEMSAAELIISIINTSTEKITLITLGPLTNIALALQSEPSIEDRIERIVIMGGAVNVPGNVGFEYPEIQNYVTEWNMYIDPHAAYIVFKSGVPVMLVPLDATNKVLQTEEFRIRLKNVMRTPEAHIVHRLITPGLFFWDQLTAIALTDPTVVTLEMHCIEVVIDNENQTGWTKSIKEDQPNAQVAVNADALKFEELFIKIINMAGTKVFAVTWAGETYYVKTFSYSTITNFNFSQLYRQISFNVTGPPGTTSFFNVTLPKSLLNANATHPWQIFLNGTDITNDTIITENATHTFIYFTYTHSTHKVQITVEKLPTPFWMQWWFCIIVSAVIVALVGVVYFLMKRKPPTTPPPLTEGT